MEKPSSFEHIPYMLYNIYNIQIPQPHISTKVSVFAKASRQPRTADAKLRWWRISV